MTPVNDILDAGVALILYLQGLGGWLIPPMELFTFLGEELFYLAVIPALYWCLDTRAGLLVGIMLMTSAGLGGLLKLIFREPRPYLYSSEVRALVGEPTFGLPSSHAMNAAAIWGLLAALAAQRWPARCRFVWVIALLIIFAIGVSRIFLGVHFPSDVLFGWAAGFLLLWAFLKLAPGFRARLAAQPAQRQFLSGFAASLLVILPAVLVRLSFGAWTIPVEWMRNFALAGPGLEAPAPLALDDIVTSGGVLFGLAAGVIWQKRFGGFNTRGPWWKRLLRYPVGLAGVLVIYAGLGAIFPRGDALLPYLLRYLRYVLVGFWVVGMAPLLFVRLGLAYRDHPGPIQDGLQPTAGVDA